MIAAMTPLESWALLLGWVVLALLGAVWAAKRVTR